MAHHDRNVVRSSWTIRRRIIIAVLLWCGGIVTYLAVFGRPNSLSETTVNGCLLLMASVIGSYVFGAVWDDRSQLLPPAGGVVESYQRTGSQPTDAPMPPMPDPGDQ
ncbi:hypothetical protein [Mesorhizobium sp. CA4]|uniref:hypothetical protein n=1 Tax=Mesorhizobium sp. CA4 TaxID=588499 RepID=UPI001CD0E75C|nr:hypothetical protein [Mesorhizobium sp. CA4]MBZ9822357.1 hypothetical protein [Mesorhizobium sp. CA4]